jgi:hypothetical protein
MDRFFKRSTPVSREETKEEPNMNETQEEKEEEEYHFRHRRENRNNEETPKPTYEEFRNTYSECDYVPISHINTVFKHHFPNEPQIIHDYDTTTKLVKIKIIDILNSIKIYNWEYNREPDIERIPLIAQNMYENRLIKTMLCFNYEFKNDEFEIIDGSHRYEAFKLLHSFSTNTNDKPDWFINEELNWLLNEYIIVQIYFQTNKEQLTELRNNINYSKPMPIEYDKLLNDKEKNKIIKDIYLEYYNRYKKCFGNGKDENMRNNKKMDRDRFYVILSKVYDKYDININRVGLLQNKLNEANQKIKHKVLEGEFNRGPHKCKNQKILDRCEETGCYLFLYNDDYLVEFI